MRRCGSELAVIAGVVSGPLLSANPRRRHFTISVPSGVQVTISTRNPAVLGTGITLTNPVEPYDVCEHRHANLVETQWQVIASAAVTIGVIEVVDM